MRGFPIVFLLLCAVPAALSSEDWVHTSEEALFVVEVTESAKIVRFSEDSQIEYVRSILDFYPRRDYRQSVRELVTFPESYSLGDSLAYEWKNPLSDELTFSLSSQVLTRHYIVPVTRRVDFPVLFVEPELEKYTQHTNSIDCDNEQIMALASDLATGETGLYEVVFKLADWVHNNVDYKMIPETMDFAQKASWVLNKRIGVCDEMTSLFVALLRSLGIPSKYVSGYAYSTEETVKQGPHAWAEVYFPGSGWVPFDVTYGEFGYLDAGHIKLRESLDADVPSSRYEWKGHRVELDTSKLTINTTILRTSGQVEPMLSVRLTPFSSEMRFGSYNYIEGKIINHNPFYVAAQLLVSYPPEVDVTPARRNVLLNPREQKSVYWLIHLKDRLISDYVYTLPFTLYSSGNFSTSTFLLGSADTPSYSRALIEDALSKRQNTVDKKYVKRLSLKCIPAFPEFYTDENLKIECLVRNNGNSRLDQVTVCRKEECQGLSLGVAQTENVLFTMPNQREGDYTHHFSAYTEEVSANESVKLKVLERPKISIGELKHPNSVSFDEDYFIGFILSKESVDEPQELLVIVNTKEFTKGWDFDELNQSQDFVVEMSGKSLRSGANPVKILVSYYDKHNRRYDVEKEIEISLTDVTAGQRFIFWYDDFRGWLSQFL